MGTIKPWRAPQAVSLWRSRRDYYERLYLELSPYVNAARAYKKQLGGDQDWMQIKTAVGAISSLTSLGNPALRGFMQGTLHRWRRDLVRGGAAAKTIQTLEAS
jgi:hypothetical protein